MPAWLRLMRPKQWTKNLLVFAALVFALKLFDMQAVVLSVLAFVSFCLASSSTYVVSDLIDAERDRQHPEKRNRPIASGQISTGQAATLAAVLATSALALAVWIAIPFAISIIGYLAMQVFYSTKGKHVVVLDVLLVAVGFVIRAVAGALAIGVAFSHWFMICTLFLALFIALSKRKAEVLALGEGQTETRPVLAQYTASALSAFTASSIAAALISYALYVVDMSELFPMLALTVPFVLFVMFRYYLLVETQGLGERPEDVVLQDPAIRLGVLGFGLVALLALYFRS